MNRSESRIVTPRASYLLLTVAAGLFGMAAGQAQADVIYVNHKAAPDGDGRSWATAFDDLHKGLAPVGEGDSDWPAPVRTRCCRRTMRVVIPQAVRR